jgi:hydroxyisourate hydrolase
MSLSSFGRRGFCRTSLASAALIVMPSVARSQGNGSLVVHALDATIGQPAAGVVVELFDVSGDTPSKVAQTVTDSDGRADVIAGRPIVVGRYEIRFAVADYFRKRGGVTISETPFLDVVPMRLYLDNPAGTYGVPMVFTPWSYSMFR